MIGYINGSSGSTAFSVYTYGEIMWAGPDYGSQYYITFSPANASGTLVYRAGTTTIHYYPISYGNGYITFGSSVPQMYFSSNCSWTMVNTNISSTDKYINGMFIENMSLQSAYLPNCTYLGKDTFIACFSLSDVSLPACTYIDTYAFASCIALSEVSLPVCSYIANNAFTGCNTLYSLTLGYSDVVSVSGMLSLTLGNITSSTGYIYVKRSLVNRYKSAPYWSYYSNVIYPMNAGYYVDWSLYSTVYPPTFSGSFSLSGETFYYNEYQSGIEGYSIITSSAFSQTSNMRWVSGNVVEIQKDAFYGCSTLSSISFPECTVIGESAFGYVNNFGPVSFYIPKVVSIGSHAFEGTNISGSIIDLPSCEYIGDWGLGGHNIPSVNLPVCGHLGCAALYWGYFSSITLPVCSVIGSSAFSGCRYLSRIQLDYSGVATLSNSNAFDYTPIASGSGKIIVPTSLVDAYRVAENWSYFASMIDTIRYVAWDPGSNYSVLSDGVITSGMFNSQDTISLISGNATYVSDSAFIEFSYLRSVYLEDCRSVGNSAFTECTSLVTLSLPKCSYIGSGAFMSCSSLSALILPVCSNIGKNAFWYASALSSVVLGEDYYLGSVDARIGAGAFFGCSSLSTIKLCAYYYLESDAWNSGSTTLYGTLITSSTGSVLVPASLVYSYKTDGASRWGYYSNRIFAYDSSDYYIVWSPSDISTGTFKIDGTTYNFSQYSGVFNGLSTGWITSSAFKNNTSISTIITNAYGISVDAFNGCTSLERVSLVSTMKISGRAFQGCYNLKYFDCSTCYEVGGNAFADCTALESISLPGCKSLLSSAFYGCTSLLSVTLNVCHSIKADAFYGTPLSTLTLGDSSVCLIHSSALNGINTDNLTVRVPSSLYSRYVAAQYWSDISSRITSF